MKKIFIRKPLILLGLFNITKKKLKKSLKKLFTFKKVVYICKVNKAQNLKTRIMKALKIENRKELKTFTHGFNYTSQKIENNVYVIFENNASIKLQSICSEIGNTFGWSEADKMKKSKSEKNIIDFINKYENFVAKYIS